MATQLSKPHRHIQSLLYNAHSKGAVHADISIHKDHIVYSDSTPYNEILDLTHLDPDYLYTVVFSIDSYPVPDKFNGVVTIHAKGFGSADKLGSPELLPKIDSNELITPRFTTDNKFKVYLCERPHNIDGLVVISHDGTVYDDNIYTHMSANKVVVPAPGFRILHKRYQIIGMFNNASDNNSKEIETRANDVDEILRIGYEMFVDYMNEQNQKGTAGYYWSTSSMRDKYISDNVLSKSPLPLNVFTQFHIELNSENQEHHTRFLLPERAVVPRSGWSVNNSLWVAMRNLAVDDERKFDLVTYVHPTRDYAEPDETVPIIWVTKASITWSDGTNTVINIPVYVGDTNLLDQTFDDDLKNIITNVSAIELEVSIRKFSSTGVQDIQTFWVPTSMFSDSGRNMILVTSDFDLNTAELAELSGIHMIGNVPDITSFKNILSEWYYDYTLNRLINGDTTTLNNEFLSKLANALDEVIVDSDNWDDTIRVASDTGNVVIYA